MRCTATCCLLFTSLVGSLCTRSAVCAFLVVQQQTPKSSRHQSLPAQIPSDKDGQTSIIAPEHIQAGKNFCSVTGADSAEIAALFQAVHDSPKLQEHAIHWLELLSTWKSVDRVSSVFIPELGSFTVSETYKELIHSNRYYDFERLADLYREMGITVSLSVDIGGPKERKELLCNVLDCPSLGEEKARKALFASPDMDLVDVIASFTVGDRRSLCSRSESRPFWDLLALPEESPERLYLIKHYGSFDWKGREDWVSGYGAEQRNLVCVLNRFARCNIHHPKRAVGIANDMYRQAWPPSLSHDEMPPPKELYQKLRKVEDEQIQKALEGERNFVFPHLISLPDKTIGDYQFRILRSEQEIAQFVRNGRNRIDYYNCLSGVEAQAIIFVKVSSASSGSPVAIGQFGEGAVASGIYHDTMDARYCWEIYEAEDEGWTRTHRPLNDEIDDGGVPADDDTILNVFMSYMGTIREWREAKEKVMP